MDQEAVVEGFHSNGPGRRQIPDRRFPVRVYLGLPEQVSECRVVLAVHHHEGDLAVIQIAAIPAEHAAVDVQGMQLLDDWKDLASPLDLGLRKQGFRAIDTECRPDAADGWQQQNQLVEDFGRAIEFVVEQRIGPAALELVEGHHLLGDPGPDHAKQRIDAVKARQIIIDRLGRHRGIDQKFRL